MVRSNILGSYPLLDIRTVNSVPGSGRESRIVLRIHDLPGSKSVARLLRHFRRRLSITQKDASRRLGVSWSTYAKWEGRKAFPKRVDFVRVVSLAFHLSLSEEKALLEAWATEFKEADQSRRELLGISRRYTHPPHPSLVPLDVKRADARDRVRRKRDMDFLRKEGWLGKYSLETLIEELGRLESGDSDPEFRFGKKTREAIDRLRSNRPKKLNFRTGKDSEFRKHLTQGNNNELRERREKGNPGRAEDTGGAKEEAPASVEETGNRMDS